ncbi:hypothetical protein [Mycoplasmopsis cynos]|uniref:hypothetical protein n=1 Tax=Mycoplasmopsis cynos TaxID=171284 RepID=UPI003A5C8992
MDYKNTLNMPQTDFEMKFNLTNKEKYFSEFWLNNDIYNKVIKKNQNNSKFILYDDHLMQMETFILVRFE